MPTRKRTSSVLNGDTDHHGQDAVAPTAPDEALALELAEAEAEAAEAEAVVAAARARARALKLRRQAEEAAASSKAATAETIDMAAPAEVESSEAAEIDEPRPITEPDSSADDSIDIDVVEDAEEGDAPARRRRLALPRIRLKVVAAALVVVLTVGFLAASAWMTFHHRQVVAEQQRSAEFAAAARQGVVTLMSLNFNSAADDVKRIIESTTGEFKKDFESQAADFTKAAQDSKVITEANVNALAVKSIAQDSATVLVAVTTNVSNAASKEQQPRSWRLNVNVARDGGQIKLAKVEFVP
jgi:Mce-associated membrane protein